MTSNYTKNMRFKYWTCQILSWFLLLIPLFVYVCIALGSDGVTNAGKVSVVGSVMVAAIFTVFNLLLQKKIRCTIWIILLGLYVAMSKFLLPLIIILAIATILDDLIFSPLASHYKMKLKASIVMDERSEAN